jgi:hypothetical protein
MSVVADNIFYMMEKEIIQGWSPLEESAIRLHELYRTLVSAGFTKDEALDLVTKAMKNRDGGAAP